MIRYGITPWAGKSLINMNFRCTPEDAKDITNRFDIFSNGSLMEGCFRFTGIIPMSQTGAFMDAMHIAIKKAQITKLQQELDELEGCNGHYEASISDALEDDLNLNFTDDFPF